MRRNIVNQKFLGLWGPLPYFCCCEQFTLSLGMSFVTIVGMIVSTLQSVRGLVLMAMGHWLMIIALFAGILEVVFFWIGNRSAARFELRGIRQFYFFSIIYAVFSIAELLLEPPPLPEWIQVLYFGILFAHIYMVYTVWSFKTRLEIGDITTLKYGPRGGSNQQRPQYPQMAQGNNIQVASQNRAGLVNHPQGMVVGGGNGMQGYSQAQPVLGVQPIYYGNVQDPNFQASGGQNPQIEIAVINVPVVNQGGYVDQGYYPGNQMQYQNQNQNQGVSSLQRQGGNQELNRSKDAQGASQEDLSIFGAPKQ